MREIEGDFRGRATIAEGGDLQRRALSQKGSGECSQHVPKAVRRRKKVPRRVIRRTNSSKNQL